MTERDESRRLRRAVAVILLAIIVLDLTVGIYHLTHRGPGSGITELALAGLLVTAVYLVFLTPAGQRSPPKAGRPRLAGLVIITLAAATLLFLAVYHLTHEGLPSFIVETIVAALLAVLACLGARSPKR